MRSVSPMGSAPHPTPMPISMSASCCFGGMRDSPGRRSILKVQLKKLAGGSRGGNPNRPSHLNRVRLEVSTIEFSGELRW